MRRLASIVLPVLALSACVGPYRGSGSDPESYRSSSDRFYDAADVPLAARIDQTGVGLGVRLNRPAYVAMFEILPGQGVGLYYPAFQPEQAYFPSGFTTLPTHGARRFDSYFTSNVSQYSRGQPHFYFLVASRQPLRSIARFQRSNGALRSVLGLSAYNTVNYRQVMDDLVQAVVPYQDDTDWTTDVLAIWPRNDYGGYYAENGGYRRVYCGDGTEAILPIELAGWGCQRHERPMVVRAPRSATPTPTPGDSSHVTPVTRHRPEPVTGGGAGGDGQEQPTRLAPQRRPTPEAVDKPQMGDGETPSSGARERPRVDAPAREPREAPSAQPRAEPKQDMPRREMPRSEPRSESPRAETPRVERSAPSTRSETPRSEPAPSSSPSRERAQPVAPPTPG